MAHRLPQFPQMNSAGDVEFAATAEYHQWSKQGKPLPEFLTGKKN